MNAREMLIALAIKHEGEWENIYKDIQNKVFLSQEEIETYSFKYSEDFTNAVTILDSNYPDYLKNIEKPPFVLFYKGNLSLLNAENKVAIIGSKKPTAKGIITTCNCANDYYEQGYTLISGFSQGVQLHALKRFHKNSIAILPCGISGDFYNRNESVASDVGLFITEYPNGVNATHEQIQMRYRIISAITDKVVANEITKTGSFNIMISYALFMGKEIECIPDTVNDNYCNTLIEEGATPVFKWCF